MQTNLGSRYGHLAHPARCACQGMAARAVLARLEAGLTRRTVVRAMAGALAATSAARSGLAAEVAGITRLTGARIFDGRSAELVEGHDVLVAGELIEAIVPRGEAVEAARVVDCSGMVIMPGLIDAHWHALLAAMPLQLAMTAAPGYIHLVAAQEAERTLLRGFTTVRDVGGPAFALKRAIDEGRFAGPRILPSGAMISQTSGHGDFRFPYELPRTPTTSLSAAEAAGISAIADGEAEVLRRVREQLMLGASQLKIMAGGGVSSLYDPLDSLQYSEAEIRAAVGAATDWGTYVCAHVYTSAGIRRALACGVRSIEHGQLADEETVRMIADAGAWWSLQAFLADEDANPQSTPEARAQQKLIAEGTERAFGLAQRYRVHMGWGTDILFNPKGTAAQGRQLAKLARWFAPVDALRLATSGNAELLALAGPRNPYPAPLGVVAAKAYADLLVFDGNPLEDLAIVGDPANRMRLIMKGGRVHKNTLAR